MGNVIFRFFPVVFSRNCCPTLARRTKNDDILAIMMFLSIGSCKNMGCLVNVQKKKRSSNAPVKCSFFCFATTPESRLLICANVPCRKEISPNATKNVLKKKSQIFYSEKAHIHSRAHRSAFPIVCHHGLGRLLIRVGKRKLSRPNDRRNDIKSTP